MESEEGEALKPDYEPKVELFEPNEYILDLTIR